MLDEGITVFFFTHKTFLISLGWARPKKPSHCPGSFEKIAIHPGITIARSPAQYGKGVFRPSTCHVSPYKYQFKKGMDDTV